MKLLDSMLLCVCWHVCGCTTLPAVLDSRIGNCEYIAVREEAWNHKRGNPVFRVHYTYVDLDGATSVADLIGRNPQIRHHARNYFLHPDGTRTYYDVGGVVTDQEPNQHNITYDSYNVRVVNGVTNPPTYERVD